MTRIARLLLSFTCLIAACLCQAASDPAEALDGKLVVSKRIWSPIFAAVESDNAYQKLRLGEEKFHRTNEAFFLAYAEYLDEPELIVQEKMYRTAVGRKIAENLVRTLFGLQSRTLTYDDFSETEKAEWEAFSRENYSLVKATESKMKGFPQFVQGRLAQKIAPLVQAK